MKPKELQILGIIIAIPLIGYAIHCNGCWAEPVQKIEPAFHIEAEAREGNEVTLEIQSMQDAKQEYEYELICRCVEAEAGNQSLIGKRLVADVILNRVDDPRFPNSVKEVIYQPGQFAVVANGSIYTVTPSEETKQAVSMELIERVEREIVYFNSGDYPSYGEKYERVGGHYFSK